MHCSDPKIRREMHLTAFKKVYLHFCKFLPALSATAARSTEEIRRHICTCLGGIARATNAKVPFYEVDIYKSFLNKQQKETIFYSGLRYQPESYFAKLI